MTDEQSNVITLRDGPTVNDIPGMLEHLARGIRSGDVGTHGTAIVILPAPPGGDAWPEVFIYGEHPGDAAIIGHIAITVTALSMHICERQP
jgi:hypothetical protein